MLVAQTGDNPILLGPYYEYMRVVGRSLNLSCLIAPTVAAAECRRALSGSERTSLNSKPLHLLQSASTFLQTSELLASSDQKRITARFSIMVQFEEGAAILQGDM
jgi:hypothetical protein